MNKKGKFNFEKFGKGFLITGASVLVLMVILAMFGVWQPKFQSVAGSELKGENLPAATTGATCSLAPSVTTAFVDAMNKGTSVSPTLTYQVKTANGQLIKTTTAPTYKATVNILANASTYLNKVVPATALDCGANLVASDMYAYSNATITITNDAGFSALVQATANETVKAAGSAYNWEVKFQGVDKKSTGRMLYVVELSVPANVSSITMGGAGVQVATVPNGYTRQLTNGYVAAFLIDPIVGTTPMKYSLVAQSSTGKVISGQVYTTVFATQPFFETDGSISDMGYAYDSLNAAKYQDTYTKNFIIV